jgi:hypothetical protein
MMVKSRALLLVSWQPPSALVRSLAGWMGAAARAVSKQLALVPQPTISTRLGLEGQKLNGRVALL